MFANSNTQSIPVIVVDSTGKRKRAKLAKLVLSSIQASSAVIEKVEIELHKKVKE